VTRRARLCRATSPEVRRLYPPSRRAVTRPARLRRANQRHRNVALGFQNYLA
jgi:hypothetical protein